MTTTLTRTSGVNYYNGVKETYYNLPMDYVCYLTYYYTWLDSTNHPYWVRSDGVKMLGPYVMVAADLNNYPRGTVVETSLGTGVVCDTGYLGPHHFDIAVDW
jgi:hypothetical protein